MNIDTNLFGLLAAIIWADLLLSGDNAIVIGLVCNELPPIKRRAGLILGTVAAIAARVVGAAFATELMAVPALSLIGGAFLIWVAMKLVDESDDAAPAHKPRTTLLAAVFTIAVADASMSLDNVMAVAAIAKGNFGLLVAGIIISIPIVIAGSALISKALERLPALKWIGVVLLGWVAGGIAATDALIPMAIGPLNDFTANYMVPFACCGVVLVGIGLRRAIRVRRGVVSA